MDKSIWLRAEVKPLEHRSALTPTTAKKLMDQGFKITVERDPQRIFDDEEFEKIGCTMEEHSAWTQKVPLTTPVLGLKEFPETDTTPLPQTHIMFAHCYKQQAGWNNVLDRFAKGNGTLYDLEFLQDGSGRRVAAFGYHAGFAGAAAGLLALDAQEQGNTLQELKPYPDETHMIDHVKESVKSASAKLGRPVRALVIGALGRCGRGACDLLVKAGINESDIHRWDMAETAKGGPFEEILDVDVFVNCIYLTSKIPSFISPESIKAKGASRNLSVVVDVSCDTTNPNNPLPIYSINTSFTKPTVDFEDTPEGSKRLTVISIDHLPTLLPREASEQFSNDLLPSLMQLPERDSAQVWKQAKDLFDTKLAEANEFNKKN